MWDTDRYVTAYAAAHPLEDWAETFAHYLHILDMVDTAESFGATGSAQEPAHWGIDVAGITIDDLVARFRLVNLELTELAACVGAPPPFPFDLAGAVIGKLGFVHRQVIGHTDRDRFYARN